MEMPLVTNSTETHLDTFGDFHLTALKAEPAAATIATGFDVVQTALGDALKVRKAADVVAAECEAILFRAEVNLEDLVKQVEGRALLHVKKNRKAEPYVTAFPKGLGGALAPTGKSQSAEARRIVTSLGPETGVPADVTALLPEVTRLATQLDEKCDASEAAARAAHAALAVEKTELRRWREQYRKDHGLLTVLWPTDRKRVESFFKKVKRNKKTTPGSGTTGGPTGTPVG
jgi:hypothetical protein